MTESLTTSLVEEALAVLNKLADSGDNTARHAAAVLRGQRCGGRPPENDDEALWRIAELIAAGKGKQAVGIVARGMAGPGKKVESIARRLRRKLAEKNGRN